MKPEGRICKFVHSETDPNECHLCCINGSYCRFDGHTHRDDLNWMSCPFSKVVTIERWKKFQEDRAN